jgi:hypothetical protein
MQNNELYKRIDLLKKWSITDKILKRLIEFGYLQEVLTERNTKRFAILKEYNKNKGYKIILSNAMGASVLYSEKSVNITKDVVAALNANYEKNKK